MILYILYNYIYVSVRVILFNSSLMQYFGNYLDVVSKFRFVKLWDYFSVKIYISGAAGFLLYFSHVLKYLYQWTFRYQGISGRFTQQHPCWYVDGYYFLAFIVNVIGYPCKPTAGTTCMHPLQMLYATKHM